MSWFYSFIGVVHNTYSGIVDMICSLLVCWTARYLSTSHPSPSVLIPALRTVGNIVTGDDLQTQVYGYSKVYFFSH